jgi:hypothetical protein
MQPDSTSMQAPRQRCSGVSCPATIPNPAKCGVFHFRRPERLRASRAGSSHAYRPQGFHPEWNTQESPDPFGGIDMRDIVKNIGIGAEEIDKGGWISGIDG